MSLPTKKPYTDSELKRAINSMFSAASLGIIISDSEGNILHTNPYANTLFGYKENELLGQKIEVLVPQKLRTKHVSHRDAFNQCPHSRAMGLGMDLYGQKRDGSHIPIEISLTHYERDGEKEIVSFVSDISQRKRAEEALKQLNLELEEKVKERTKELSEAFQELQHSNQNLSFEMEQRKKAEAEVREALEKEKELSDLKSRFVSMASHEFRTPLSGILSSAQLIGRYLSTEDQAKREKHIQTIKTSVARLTDILNDFLSLEKLEQGKIFNKPQEFDLVFFVNELIPEAKILCKANQEIGFETNVSSLNIFLDPHLLRTILSNLISNAIKYSEKNISIKLDQKAECFEISVSDLGIGIPLEDQAHLFETFFRAQNATTISGTGLGLNIIKRCLDLMQGEITFKSTPNEGSTFTLTLPLKNK